MNYSTEIYIELFKRKEFRHIPIYEDETGVYYPSEKQIYALNLLTSTDCKTIGFGGSARAGKSAILCFWQIFSRLSYPGTRGLIGRKELKNLRITTGKTLFSMLNFYGLHDKEDYNYNQQDHIIKFKNKSEILLMDTASTPSDPLFTRFGGLELTDAAIDESNETSVEAINIIFSRIGWCLNAEYGLPRKMLETFNPEKNHVYNRFWKPFRDEKETVETKFVKALPSDNPHPSVNGWIEDIKKKGDKRMIQRLIYGNFDYDDSDNSLCNFDKILDIFTNTFVKGGQKYMSCDIAINNDAFVIVNWDGMRVEDIKYMVNISPTKIETKSDGTQNSIIDFKPLTDLILQQAHKYKVPRSNIVWDADGIGHTMIKLLPGGVALNNNSPSTNGEYKNIKCQLEFLLAEMINSAQIYCNPSIVSDVKEKLIEELQMIKRSTEVGEKLATMKKADIKTLLGRSPDIMDAIKYRLLFKITRNS